MVRSVGMNTPGEGEEVAAAALTTATAVQHSSNSSPEVEEALEIEFG